MKQVALPADLDSRIKGLAKEKIHQGINSHLETEAIEDDVRRCLNELLEGNSFVETLFVNPKRDEIAALITIHGEAEVIVVERELEKEEVSEDTNQANKNLKNLIKNAIQDAFTSGQSESDAKEYVIKALETQDMSIDISSFIFNTQESKFQVIIEVLGQRGAIVVQGQLN